MTALLPVDYDALRVALVAAAAAGTGLPAGQVIMLEPELPNAPRPPVPYIGIQFTSASIAEGQDWPVAAPDAPGQRTGAVVYTGCRSAAVSFETYGQTHEQAYGVMAALQASLMVPPVQALLAAAGAAVQRVGAVADLSSLLNTAFEGRAQMDVSLNLMSYLPVDAGLMDSADVTGTVDIDDIATATVTVALDREA